MPTQGEKVFLFNPVVQPSADFIELRILLAVDLPAGLVIGTPPRASRRGRTHRV